ncbi:hypothetical protein ALC56_06441 [Trachymyrmex septentrionalis]|uniref:Uncharacterized protein n=1 Tax=Trachymyrmex septentrionalis TaxID=34720 RepID=A0A195FEB1_9HYME|nr:hypothetical protein ALC56_06441 [Trachymyrmex septentrionalis]
MSVDRYTKGNPEEWNAIAWRDGKRGLASAVSSNRLDNLQEALEPRCGAGLVEDLPSGYPRNPVGLACRILHVPEALTRGSS